MELQQRLPDFDRAGIRLFAVSYDAVAVLAHFAERFHITYPLLSDEGSHAIRALGLYNEHLLEQQQFYGREARPEQYGVPYPGIFRLDEQGIVVAKHFEQSYRVRPAPAGLLEDVRASTVSRFAVSQRVEHEGITLTAGLDSATYRPYEKHVLGVTIELAPGLHLYAAPVPEGSTPLEVEVEPFEGLELGAIDLPPAHPFQVAGVDEEFQVLEGTITGTVPFTIVPYQESVTLSVQVRYQACSETVCYPPSRAEFALSLRGVDLIRD